MLKDKIIQIVKNLTEVTNNNLLVWSETDPFSKSRKHRREMFAIGEDETHYKMEINFILKDDKWLLQDEPSLWVKNKLLPDGLFYITHYKCEGETENLRRSIIEKYCQDMNPTIEDVEDVLEQISKGISISEYRKNRLNKILK